MPAVLSNQPSNFRTLNRICPQRARQLCRSRVAMWTLKTADLQSLRNLWWQWMWSKRHLQLRRLSQWRRIYLPCLLRQRLLRKWPNWITTLKTDVSSKWKTRDKDLRWWARMEIPTNNGEWSDHRHTKCEDRNWKYKRTRAQGQKFLLIQREVKSYYDLIMSFKKSC